MYGQWTTGPATLTIKRDEGGGSVVDIVADVRVYSLTGLISSPAQRMVDKIARGLGADGSWRGPLS